jgi:hypothetical protein
LALLNSLSSGVIGKVDKMNGLRLAVWLKYQRVNSTAMATLAEYLPKFKRENANALLDLFILIVLLFIISDLALSKSVLLVALYPKRLIL